MEIKYDEITTEKFSKNLWIAKCNLISPIKSEVTMKGTTEVIAKQKLTAFLNNEPYSHLDK